MSGRFADKGKKVSELKSPTAVIYLLTAASRRQGRVERQCQPGNGKQDGRTSFPSKPFPPDYYGGYQRVEIYNHNRQCEWDHSFARECTYCRCRPVPGIGSPVRIKEGTVALLSLDLKTKMEIQKMNVSALMRVQDA
jgi:hypothetical protein